MPSTRAGPSSTGGDPTEPVRIGFLFNHEAPHQVAHALPIALALLEHPRRPDVTLYLAPGDSAAEVRRLWAEAGGAGDDPRLIALDPAGWPARIGERLTGSAAPLARIDVLRRNRRRFAALDALVVPEKTSTLLKSRFGLPHLRLIHTRHGAGDRAIGFDAASARFDFVLVSGPKIRDRLLQAGLVGPGQYAVTGYPKLDLFARRPRPRLFGDARPVILYNPHPDPDLSSWHAAGPAILRHLARSGRWNVIFAPHVMLFRRRLWASRDPVRLRRTPPVPPDLLGLPHLLIDTGSRASVDMTYTLAADIYLGDASSQVYEFLARPRPAIFWSNDRLDRRADPNFAHWRAGPVVGSLATLDAAIEAALAGPDLYADAQRALVAASFDTTGGPAAPRAADAILAFLDRAA